MPQQKTVLPLNRLCVEKNTQLLFDTVWLARNCLSYNTQLTSSEAEKEHDVSPTTNENTADVEPTSNHHSVEQEGANSNSAGTKEQDKITDGKDTCTSNQVLASENIQNHDEEESNSKKQDLSGSTDLKGSPQEVSSSSVDSQDSQKEKVDKNPERLKSKYRIVFLFCSL